MEIDENAEDSDAIASDAMSPCHELNAMSIVVRDEAGEHCATATAWIGAGAPPVLERAMPPLPVSRPPASAATLAPGTVLGTLVEPFDADLANEYLDGDRRRPRDLRRRADCPSRLVAAPRQSDPRRQRLARSVDPRRERRPELRSRARRRSGVHTRPRCVREWERRGHRFVTIDVQIAAGPESSERLVVADRHTAIYEPRRPDQ